MWVSPPTYDKETSENFFDDKVFSGLTNTQELDTSANELFFNQSVDIRILNVSKKLDRFKGNLESSVRNSPELDTFIATFESTNNVALRIGTAKKLNERK